MFLCLPVFYPDFLVLVSELIELLFLVGCHLLVIINTGFILINDAFLVFESAFEIVYLMFQFLCLAIKLLLTFLQ